MMMPLLMAAAGALSFDSIYYTVIGFLGVICAFGAAVFIHELGHYLAAKAFGVSVERFVIGFDKEAMPFMPPCIIERKWGETTYGLSLVPLGGYVKMAGTVHPDIERYLDGDNAPAKGSLQEQAVGDMAALYKKPFWQKFIIYAAGVTMNMILAAVIITYMFTVGYVQSAPYDAKVGWFPADSVMAQQGLTPGDRILSINGTDVKDTADVMRVASTALEAAMAVEGTAPKTADLAMKIARAGDTGTYDFKFAYPIRPAGEDAAPLPAEDEALVTAFWEVFNYHEPYIEMVIPNAPAEKAGMRDGDLIVAVDGVPMVDWNHFRHIVRTSIGKALSVEIQTAKGEKKTVTMTPWESTDTPGQGQVGVLPGNAKKETIRESFFDAAANSPGRVVDFTVTYVERLQALFGKIGRGNVVAAQRELGGPVGIANMAYKRAQAGLQAWLNFLIMLNVALAVMNSLPIPVLDGGHVCFAIYEAIFRRPVSPRILVPVLNGAVMVFITFFVLVTFNDLWKIFS